MFISFISSTGCACTLALPSIRVIIVAALEFATAIENWQLLFQILERWVANLSEFAHTFYSVYWSMSVCRGFGAKLFGILPE